jgi:UDP-GlcNAc:undecaprenyl-phosphate GlcNAc-1-phosphate transferase
MTLFAGTVDSMLTTLGTLALVMLFRPVAFKIGLVDAPDQRKRHEGRVPLVGGIAIFCGFLFSTLSLDIPLLAWMPLFTAAALLLIVGVLDDVRNVSVRNRFLSQMSAIMLVAVWGGTYLQSLGDLLGFGDIALNWFAIPFTLFGAVGVMNAFNMIDGLDGLSSGLSLILFATLALLAQGAGLSGDAAVLSALFACTMGFFLCNFRFIAARRALSFLGNSGSLFLGFVIAYLLVKYSQGPEALFRPVTALWLYAVPLMDTVSVMVHRVKTGGSAFAPDREHLHHMLQRAGLSVRLSVLLILLAQLGMTAVGLLGEYYGVPEYWMFCSFMALFILYHLSIRRAWIVVKFQRLSFASFSVPMVKE